MTTIADPARREIDQRLVDRRRRPASTPQVGCDTISTSGTCSTSRPMMNFCRLPPDSDPAVASGPVAFTAKTRITSSA